MSVATGEVWCAHGEDTGGSIRILASFCSVVGLRPTPGLVTGGQPIGEPPTPLEVHGPLCRDVADTALFLSAMAEASPDEERMPHPHEGPPGCLPGRIAFSVDYGGALPVDPEIARICERAVRRLEAASCEIDQRAPDLGGMQDACLTLIAYRAAVKNGERVDRHGERIGPAVRSEVAAGRAISTELLISAKRKRAAFGRSVRALFDDHDLFVTPTFGVPPWTVTTGTDPFPAEPELRRIAAVWPLTTVAAMAGCPAVTLPCGRTAAGHPVGLQLIGPPMCDVHLLRTAQIVEEICAAGHHPTVTPS